MKKYDHAIQVLKREITIREKAKNLGTKAQQTLAHLYDAVANLEEINSTVEGE